MKTVILLVALLVVFYSTEGFTQATASRQASGQEAQLQMQEKERKLRQRIERAPAPRDIQTESGGTTAAPDTGEKVLINTIEVSGNTVLSGQEVDNIVKPYEGQNLSIRGMQKVADLLTDAYRQRGYITTRVILPPQQVSDHVLRLQVIQGSMGDVSVRGNRYFKSSLFTNRINLHKGEAFDYDKLRNNLRIINEHPDRTARAVLMPGKDQGQTDVLLNVEDRQPIHLGLSYDNFASRYLNKNRYTGWITDNNLLGMDDILTLQYQMGEANAYKLLSGRYLLPVGPNTQIGVFAAHDYIKLKEEFKDLDARGKSKLYSAFVNQNFVDHENLKVTGSVGFDYKDVFNFQLGNEVSRDRLRIAKVGINIDGNDMWYGRNIVNNDLSFGIPNIMAGLDSVDARSSRVGAGGKFTKDVLDLLRLQAMPWDTSLFLKGEAQFSSTILPAVEQYQLGGIANVRGFDPGEAVGDSGQSFTAEYSVPLYFIPRDMRVPFSKARLYDAVRVAAFYDWGHVNLRNPQAGETKNRHLDSIGLGLRFNLPEDFSFRVDFAHPTTGTGTDGRKNRIWFQVTKVF